MKVRIELEMADLVSSILQKAQQECEITSPKKITSFLEGREIPLTKLSAIVGTK